MSGFTGSLFVDFASGSFTEQIKFGDNLAGLVDAFDRMSVFIGDFVYMENILHPVFVDIVENKNWVIANVSDPELFFEPEDETALTISATQEYITVPDLVEFSPTTIEVIFNSTNVKFSDFSLGSIFEHEDGRYIVAGIISDSGVNLGITKEKFLEAFAIQTKNILFRADSIDALSSFRGAVTTIERDTDKFNIFYRSSDGLYPSDIDLYDNQDILVAESSYVDPSGRLIKLDTFGNVIFSLGQGSFNVIHDAKILTSNNIMLSL